MGFFFFFFWPFGLFPLKNLSSIHLPISSLGHWFMGRLIFWTPYIFWLLIPFRCTAGKDFLSFYRLLLQSADHFFCCPESFYFHVVKWEVLVDLRPCIGLSFKRCYTSQSPSWENIQFQSTGFVVFTKSANAMFQCEL
jgi:hypothetical protein